MKQTVIVKKKDQGAENLNAVPPLRDNSDSDANFSDTSSSCSRISIDFVHHSVGAENKTKLEADTDIESKSSKQANDKELVNTEPPAKKLKTINWDIID